MSIGGIKCAAVRVVTYLVSVNIISIIVTVCIAVGPVVTFVETVGIGFGEGAVLDFLNHRSPFFLIISTIMHLRGSIISRAYLATGNLHMRITHDKAVLTATVCGGRDKCGTADFQMCFLDHGKEVGRRISKRVGFATATAENITHVVFVCGRTDIRHDGLVDAHLSPTNQHLGLARTCGTSFWLSCDMRSRRHIIKLREGAHRAKLATAIEAVFNDASFHVDLGIAFHQTGLNIIY